MKLVFSEDPDPLPEWQYQEMTTYFGGTAFYPNHITKNIGTMKLKRKCQYCGVRQLVDHEIDICQCCGAPFD